jgi:hypothetical protein
LRTANQNLLVIDYKANAITSGLLWPNYGKDIWRTNGQENIVTSVEEDENIPREFSLRQNYPNPFNARTVIGFNLPKRSRVRLEIYDILGMIDKSLPSGYNSVSWNAGNKSSGIYFYRITTGRQSLTRRMLLIK